MSQDDVEQIRQQVDAVYRAESRRVLATLIRLLGDFDLAEEALHDAFTAAVERWTDGPFAETKEQLGGFVVLEARDLNHAIQLISAHPGVKVGPFEIRPVDDMTEAIRASERRRSSMA
ncbi:MAG TPA: YciI family protein [Thermoanaerobaculia bacterium]|jgi:hypothetical protein